MRLKDNNNPFIHVNPPYQLMVIHSSKLVYPRELYQRGVERKRVELIAAHFNEYVANEPKVSFRNGQFIVTDGQHTIEGRILRNGGKDLPILCKVYTGMTVEQEALLFAEQNGFSAPLTAGIKLRAKVVGGDAISKAFLAATNRVGLSLNYDSQQLTDYRIGCVGTAFRLYKQMGEPLYCETMRLIVAAWEGKPDSFRASVLKGMMHFVELYHGEFSEERLLRSDGFPTLHIGKRMVVPKDRFLQWMQALGVDIQTIQSIVGHADTEMTEHYLHVQESIRQSAIQLFSEAFSA